MIKNSFQEVFWDLYGMLTNAKGPAPTGPFTLCLYLQAFMANRKIFNLPFFADLLEIEAL